MAARKNGAIRILRVKKEDNLQTLYAKARAAFTASDLQKYTEDEEMFPAEGLIKELETIHREEVRKRRGKKA
jgi:hypothetical protein